MSKSNTHGKYTDPRDENVKLRKTSVAIPEDIYELIIEESREDVRSINSFIVALLTRYFRDKQRLAR